MNSKAFWDSVNAIIAEGFSPEGLQKLDEYAEQFVRHPHQHTRVAMRGRAGTDDGGAIPRIIIIGKQ